MRILFVEPNAEPRAIEIDGSLASMQSLVGGLIEAIYPFSDPVALICNDEGKLIDLPQNRPLKHSETGEIYEAAAPKGKVVNSVGAGDSMVAGFITGYIRGGNYEEALKSGTAAGSATAFSEGLASLEMYEKMLKQITE